mmetsp:Transcript_9036/g.39764  ORF Transcript_9036/g.39764 Transcript_9036/m.39764 type:complete len:200 (+) Transcript_9036:1611-2210(+)
MRPEHVGSRDGGEARVTRRGRGAASLAHRPEELLEHRGGALRLGIRTRGAGQRRLEDIPTERRGDDPRGKHASLRTLPRRRRPERGANLRKVPRPHLRLAVIQEVRQDLFAKSHERVPVLVRLLPRRKVGGKFGSAQARGGEASEQRLARARMSLRRGDGVQHEEVVRRGLHHRAFVRLREPQHRLGQGEELGRGGRGV